MSGGGDFATVKKHVALSLGTSKSVEMQERLIGKVRECKRPTNKSEVRAFVGLTGFYRHYIANFAEKHRRLLRAYEKFLEEREAEAEAEVPAE